MRTLDCNVFCVNGDGNRICPPSKVLCQKCLDEIGKKMQKILDQMKNREVRREQQNGNDTHER